MSDAHAQAMREEAEAAHRVKQAEAFQQDYQLNYQPLREMGYDGTNGGNKQQQTFFRFDFPEYGYDTNCPMHVICRAFYQGGVMRNLFLHTDVKIFTLMALVAKVFLPRLQQHKIAEVWINSLENFDVDDLKVMASMMAFFFVFYNGHCYARFQSCYNRVLSISNHCAGFYAWVTGHLYTDEAAMNNLCRYVLLLFHVVLAEIKPENEEKEWSELWDLLLKRNIITPHEAAVMSQRIFERQMPSAVAAQWGMRECHAVIESKVLPPPVAGKVGAMFFTLIDLTRDLRGYVKMPVPEMYYQMLNMLMYVYLMALILNIQPMEEGTVPFMHNIWNTVVDLCTMYSFFCLRELSVLLADPFGEDLCDINLNWYVVNSYNTARSMLISAKKFNEQMKVENHQRHEASEDLTLGEEPGANECQRSIAMMARRAH